uniref:Uncharacterized protein n=1 Tax=Rhizophora mucronata TaxID=61149 RepID=A0A2P2QYV4_RHIMU
MYCFFSHGLFAPSWIRVINSPLN